MMAADSELTSASVDAFARAIVDRLFPWSEDGQAKKTDARVRHDVCEWWDRIWLARCADSDESSQ